jgi:putative hydrolase of the HAD superfamily
MSRRLTRSRPTPYALAVAIDHVLLDADGVIQDLPGGWHAAMEPYLGANTAEFLLETWSDELPMLVGEGDYWPILEAGLQKYQATAGVHEVYREVWCRLELVESSILLVHQLRAAGYGVHLATNQEEHRGGFMRTELGYDELFDVSCYSYDLGALKPDEAFFTEAVTRIGSEASQVLFIDDTKANVEGARRAGLVAEHWHFTEGHEVLLDHLSRHGVKWQTGRAP